MKISMDKKYRTRDGRDVRLLCVDGPEEFPVVGIVNELATLEWTSDGLYHEGQQHKADLIEYHETDIRTIWVNVYETHVVSHPSERDAEILATDAAIAIAQPVTFEVKRDRY